MTTSEKKTQILSVGGLTVTIPGEYQPLQKQPDYRPNGKEYGLQNDETRAFLEFFPIPLAEWMPMDDKQAIIDGIHAALDEEQGLIEVETFSNPNGGRGVYSIIKSELHPYGVQYFLRFQYTYFGLAYELQAFFDEIGGLTFTGLREEMIYDRNYESGKIQIVNGVSEGWAADPYDPAYTKGFRRNLSEDRNFDHFFPDHPLSMARALVDCIIKAASE